MKIILSNYILIPECVNKKLYEEVKAEIYKKYPHHSAYRSGVLVKEYKRRGGTYEGQEKQTEGLNRLFREEWKNQRGEVGYEHKGDVYGPNVRITKETPTSFQELQPKSKKLETKN